MLNIPVTRHFRSCVRSGSSNFLMELFGIKFAPLNVPLERRLQTLAVATWFHTFTVVGILISIFATLYLVLYTGLRWVVLPYLIWIYFIDHRVGETGGRPSPWIKSLTWWRYVRDYFPLKFLKLDGVTLDPDKNYFLIFFPHGVFPAGTFNSLVSCRGSEDYFPHHHIYFATLPIQFFVPFYRELVVGLGGVMSSLKGLEYVLRKPGGGNVLGITVGGAKEAFNCKPGVYRIVLRHRKGFVKLALRNGVALVPVFSFGETELFDQLDGPRLRRFQQALQKWTGIAPVIPLGRGFFQYSFGFIPRRHPVVTLVGKPIEVPKIENPNQKDIDKYHDVFMEKLTELFEENKHKYLQEPETKKLIIE